MKTMSIISALAAAILGTGTASAADSPAQTGYCLQSIKTQVETFSRREPPPQGVSQQEWDNAMRDANAKMDAVVAQLRKNFDLWMAYALSLPTETTSEQMRGAAQAKADDARVATVSASCGNGPDFPTCLDALFKGELAYVRKRNEACNQGPSL